MTPPVALERVRELLRPWSVSRGLSFELPVFLLEKFESFQANVVLTEYQKVLDDKQGDLIDEAVAERGDVDRMTLALRQDEEEANCGACEAVPACAR
jgi:hypothetical protein